MSGRRQERVSDLLRDEVSEIMLREMNDPRLGFVSITRVELSPDLRYARFFVSVFAEENERKEAVVALNNAAGFIRRTLAPRLKMRSIPELSFRLDQSMEHAENVARILRDLETKSGPEATGTDEEQRST
jgi:ribosome-binding factor A